MSVGGPSKPGEACSEDSDVCEYGEHAKCDGRVDHRDITAEWYDEKQNLVYYAAKAEPSHMCMCLCHFMDRGDRFVSRGRSFSKTWEEHR